MTPVSPDLLMIAERALTEGATLDFHRRVEIVAAVLQAERDRCADAIKGLAKTVRRGGPA
jgi:hypothetical protein